MRRGRGDPRARQPISEHRRRTLAARLHRRVLRGSRSYRALLRRRGMRLHGDWVRVIAKYDILPTPDGRVLVLGPPTISLLA